MSLLQPKRSHAPNALPSAAPPAKPTSKPPVGAAKANKPTPIQQTSARSQSPGRNVHVVIAAPPQSKALPPKPTRSVSASGKAKVSEPREQLKENTASNPNTGANPPQAKKSSHKPVISTSRPSSKQSQAPGTLATQRTQSTPSPPPSTAPTSKPPASQIPTARQQTSARISPSIPKRPASPNSTKISDLKRDFHVGASLQSGERLNAAAQACTGQDQPQRTCIDPINNAPAKHESDPQSSGRCHLWIRIPPDYAEEDSVNIKTTCSHSQDPLMGLVSGVDFITEEDFDVEDITSQLPAPIMSPPVQEVEDEYEQDITHQDTEIRYDIHPSDCAIEEHINQGDCEKGPNTKLWENPDGILYETKYGGDEAQQGHSSYTIPTWTFGANPCNHGGNFPIPTSEQDFIWDREHVWNQIPADLMEYLMEAEMGYGEPLEPMYIGDSIDSESFEEELRVRAARRLRFSGDFSASGLYQLKRTDNSKPLRHSVTSRASKHSNAEELQHTYKEK